MSKYAIVNFFDKLFISFAIFLFIFAWINFYLRDLFVSFVFSIVLSFSTIFLLFYWLNKKNEKKNLSKSRKKKIELTFLSFKLMNTTSKIELLKKILKEFNPTTKKEKIIYMKDSKSHLVILATFVENLNNEKIINLIDEHYSCKVDEIDIICSSKSVSSFSIFKDTKINIIDKNSLFSDWFEKSNIYPNTENIKIDTKLKFKEILRAVFLPQKAKSYFFCGLILIFSSIIIPFRVYYVVVGSMLILFAIICKLMPKFSSD